MHMRAQPYTKTLARAPPLQTSSRLHTSTHSLSLSPVAAHTETHTHPSKAPTHLCVQTHGYNTHPDTNMHPCLTSITGTNRHVQKDIQERTRSHTCAWLSEPLKESHMSSRAYLFNDQSQRAVNVCPALSRHVETWTHRHTFKCVRAHTHAYSSIHTVSKADTYMHTHTHVDNKYTQLLSRHTARFFFFLQLY